MDLLSAPFLARLTVALQTDDRLGFEKLLANASAEEVLKASCFAVATCFYLSQSAAGPWVAALLTHPSINSANLRRSNLLCKALESGSYDCVPLLWEHGVRVEQADRWNSLLVQALAHDCSLLELGQWPEALLPSEPIVAQAAAFRLLNPDFDQRKLQGLEALRQPGWKGFSFEVCLTLMRSPSMALSQFSTLLPGLGWAMEQGWVSTTQLEHALAALPLPLPQSVFEQRQNEEAKALLKALASLEIQRHMNQTMEPPEDKSSGRQRL